MKYKYYLSVVCLILPVVASAVTIRAKVYDLDGDLNKQLFQFERVERIENNKKIIDLSYKDLKGEPALIEQIIYPSNSILNEVTPFESYSFNRIQSQEKAIVKNENGKLKFHYEKNDKIKDNVENFGENTIVRDQYVALIRKNWEALMKGEKMKARIVLPDRLETISFGLKKDNETQLNGKPVVVFKLTPTSFIIAMVAKDAFFTIEKEGDHRLMRVEARTPVLKKVGDELKNMFGRLDFEYTP